MIGLSAFIYHDEYLKYQFGPSHPFKPIREKYALNILQELGVFDDKAKIYEPEPATEEETFHEPRKGIWQPSDKEFSFGDKVAEITPPGEEPEPPKKKKPPMEKEKELRKKKEKPEKLKEKDLAKKKMEKKKEKLKEEPPEKIKEGKKGKAKPLKIRCKCGGEIVVKTSKRPVKIQCPNCGKTGTLKK